MFNIFEGTKIATSEVKVGEKVITVAKGNDNEEVSTKRALKMYNMAQGSKNKYNNNGIILKDYSAARRTQVDNFKRFTVVYAVAPLALEGLYVYDGVMYYFIWDLETRNKLPIFYPRLNFISGVDYDTKIGGAINPHAWQTRINGNINSVRNVDMCTAFVEDIEKVFQNTKHADIYKNFYYLDFKEDMTLVEKSKATKYGKDARPDNHRIPVAKEKSRTSIHEVQPQIMNSIIKAYGNKITLKTSGFEYSNGKVRKEYKISIIEETKNVPLFERNGKASEQEIAHVTKDFIEKCGIKIGSDDQTNTNIGEEVDEDNVLSQATSISEEPRQEEKTVETPKVEEKKEEVNVEEIVKAREEAVKNEVTETLTKEFNATLNETKSSFAKDMSDFKASMKAEMESMKSDFKTLLEENMALKNENESLKKEIEQLRKEKEEIKAKTEEPKVVEPKEIIEKKEEEVSKPTEEGEMDSLMSVSLPKRKRRKSNAKALFDQMASEI